MDWLIVIGSIIVGIVLIAIGVQAFIDYCAEQFKKR